MSEPEEEHVDPTPPATDQSPAAEPEMATFSGEWPTHGGYLGCLMGMFVGCVLAGFLSGTLISFVHFARSDAQAGFVIAAILVLVISITLFGRIGWGLGKRFYRDYNTSARSATPR